MRALRRALRTAGFAAAAAAVLPMHVVHERLVPERGREALKERYKRAWSGAMLRLFGIELRVLDPVPPMPCDRGRVLVANHRSALDIAIVMTTFGGHMLSRADIAGWPLLGPIARRTDTVFVDRSQSASGASAIRGIVQLLERGKLVSVFAEGTTFEGDEVRPFHAGAFLAAMRAGADVLPVGIAYERGSEAAYRDESFLAHLGRVASAGSSRVAVAIGAPIDVPPGSSRRCAENARAEVERLVARGRSALA